MDDQIDVRRQAPIVTGAATGIGRAIALRLAVDGMRVTIDDLNESGANDVAHAAAAHARGRRHCGSTSRRQPIGNR
jgi:NAD(P)-dependent dehydrogenase (short-subunit alcohol dehydrogenase family)